MNINIFAILIFFAPLELITKGIYYLIINSTKEGSKIRKYSVVKTDNLLEFHIKNKFIAKAYFYIGSIVVIFSTIFNICYPTYNIKRAILVFIAIFLIDVFIEALANTKCKIYEYDKKKESEDIDY